MYQNNIERLFDITVKKALPYLILSPPDFRNKLVEQMDSLFHFIQGGDSSITTFIECNDGILGMLKDTKISFDSTTNRRIDAFDSRYKSFDERIRELDERLIKLEKGRNEKKIEKLLETSPIIVTPSITTTPMPSINETVIDTSTKIDGFKTEVKNIHKDPSPIMERMVKRKKGRPRKDATSEPEIAQTKTTPSFLPATCPSCGKSLQHKSLKMGERYYCFESKGGCGKHYTIANGVLMEKTIESGLSYMCQCGQKLHGQGKRDIDGELYQIYACKKTAQGGCGIGYIMDKDGDLHIGRSKTALSRPKILKPSI